jgi:hypothetical protein
VAAKSRGKRLKVAWYGGGRRDVEVVTATGRWSIETTFQEMRAHLGQETTRGRAEHTVLRVVPCVFGLYSVVTLLYSQLPHRGRRLFSIYWPGKTDVAFSDAICTVCRWLWA